MADEPEQLKVEIFSLYSDIRPPERASGSVRGSLPSRAVQHCPPVTAASGLGWYIFPPVDFALRWDGQETSWSLLVENEPAEWRSLAGGYDAKLQVLTDAVAALPERFSADADIFDFQDRGVSFLDADPRAQHTLEITTGTVARTSPGWCLLARGVPNWPNDGGHQVLEGLVETDWYRSTIPTILRLTTPGKVVRFYRDTPLMLLQPVHRSTFAALGRADLTVCRGLAEWPDDLWAEYVDMRRKRQDPTKRSAYRREQRVRARLGHEPVVVEEPSVDLGEDG
jgi:Family of unknown function (DUF6065)